MFKFKKIAFVALVLALAAGGYFYLQKNGGNDAAARVATATVAKGTVEDIVTAQGKMEPKDYVDVGIQVSGQLTKMHVDVGSQVTAGDLLAEIDPEIYAAQVRGDEARLKTLEAQLQQQTAERELARQQFKRNEQLLTSQAISRDAYDISRTAMRVAEARHTALNAQLEEAQSTLERNRANLGYAKVYAPIGGTVVSQSLREGQTVNATQSSPVLLRIADLDVMTVRAQAAEADVMRIREGTDVYFTTMGSQDRRWTGTVRQILPSPEVVNNVVLYNVLIDVDNRDRKLMDGMSAQVFFVLGRAQDVLVVPVAALGKRMRDADTDDTEAYQIRVRSAESVTEKTVQIGLMSRTLAEIRSGLAAGDTVVIESAIAPAAQTSASRRPRF